MAKQLTSMALTGITLFAGTAQADLYNWSYSAGSASGSGQFEVSSGVITTWSGTWQGVTISGLLTPGTGCSIWSGWRRCGWA